MTHLESNPEDKKSFVKCIGILGRLFGHKFIKQTGGLIYTSKCCYRCGFKKEA